MRLALALLLFPLTLRFTSDANVNVQSQEEKIESLIDKLSDDSIDVREEAARELAQMGDAALPRLRELARGPQGELSSRAAKIIADVEKNRRMAGIRRAPKLVTLQAENKPVRELIARLRELTGNDVDASAVPPDAKATVSLTNASFYQALDAICKSNGGIMWRIGSRVKLVHEAYVDYPKLFKSGYMIALNRVEACDQKGFGNNDRGWMTLQFGLFWEKGNRPGRVGLQAKTIRDDKGNDLFDARSGGFSGLEELGESAQICHPLMLYSIRAPDAEATRVTVDAEIEIEYIITYMSVSFPDPASRVNTTEKCEKFSATIARFSRKDGRVQCDLTLTGGISQFAFSDAGEVLLIAKDGKPYKGSYSGSWSDGRQTTYQMRFQVSDDVALKELTVRVPGETQTETLDALFKDISIP